MAIDHDSPFKELRLKNRRIMGGGGPEAEDEEESAAEALVVAAAAAAHDDEQEDEERWPRWLRPLLSARFFAQCKSHADSHRSRECNMFCLDCAAAADAADDDASASDAALCSLCLSHLHHDHHTIQIRRSSYHDVIRVSDIQRFMDIGGVQTYVINSARVVFLNERPQHKPGKAAASSTVSCEVCSRSLLDNFRFCSLGCKLTSSSSSSSIPIPNKRPRHSDDGSSSRTRNAAAAAAHSFSPSTPPPPPTNRRKGIPHRAPFGTLIF